MGVADIEHDGGSSHGATITDALDFEFLLESFVNAFDGIGEVGSYSTVLRDGSGVVVSAGNMGDAGIHRDAYAAGISHI